MGQSVADCFAHVMQVMRVLSCAGYLSAFLCILSASASCTLHRN